MIYEISKNRNSRYQQSTFLELRKWLKDKTVIAIDSETRSSNFKDLFETEMIMFQIGDRHDQWIIDVRDYDITPIRSILESNNILKIGHNIKYDYKVLSNDRSITLENVWDTLVCEQILDNGNPREKGYYTLQSTHQRYYDSDPYSDQLSLFDPFIPKSKRNEISKKDTEPFDEAEIFYGATDIITAFKVYEKQFQLIQENNQVELMNLENEFTLVLGDCEINGMPINERRWVALAEWSSQKSSEELDILKKLHPEVTNWNSHVQVKKLFKSLGIPITKNIKGESKDSIQGTTIKQYADKFDIITPYLKYKGLEKLSTTYGIKFLKHVNSTTKRIHSSFIQNVDTGRTASSDPNLQNIKSAKPDFLEGIWWREAFECDEGYSFVISDYGS